MSSNDTEFNFDDMDDSGLFGDSDDLDNAFDSLDLDDDFDADFGDDTNDDDDSGGLEDEDENSNSIDEESEEESNDIDWGSLDDEGEESEEDDINWGDDNTDTVDNTNTDDNSDFDLSDYEHLNDQDTMNVDEDDIPEPVLDDTVGDPLLDGLSIQDSEDEEGYEDGAIVNSDDLIDDEDDNTLSGISSDFISETGGVKVQDANDDKEEGFKLRYVNIENILIPNRARKAESEGSLTQSVRNTGLLQPLVVAPTMTEGNFVLLDGFRRIQACAKSGINRVPCVVNYKVSTPEIPIIEVMYNHNRPYNIKEKIEYIEYLEKEKGIMQPTMIEYLLQMNNGDYSKLKDVLSDNDPDIIEKLYDGTYDIATAFKKLEQRRKKESAEEKENKKAQAVYSDTESSGINQIEGAGEESTGEPMSEDAMKQLAMSIENLDEEVEEKSLNEMVDEDNAMPEYAPHKQEVGNREYIDPAIRKAVMARDNFTCKACKAGGESLVDTLDLHHTIPVWLGGVDSVDNSVMLCVACHRMVHLYSTGDLTILPALLKDNGFDDLDDKQKVRYKDKITKYENLDPARRELYGTEEKYEEEQMRTLYLDEQARFKRIVYLGSQIRKKAAEQGKDRDQLKKEHPNTGIGRRKPGKNAPQEQG